MRGSLAPQAIRRRTRHNPVLGIVGQGSDAAVSLAVLIAAQRADYGIPHTLSCRALGVSQAWFYKWRSGDGSPQRHRRKALAATIAWLFTRHRGTYGSPRITADLHDMGWRVSKNEPSPVLCALPLLLEFRSLISVARVNCGAFVT